MHVYTCLVARRVQHHRPRGYRPRDVVDDGVPAYTVLYQTILYDYIV